MAFISIDTIAKSKLVQKAHKKSQVHSIIKVMGREETLMCYKTMEAWGQNTTDTIKAHKEYSKIV